MKINKQSNVYTIVYIIVLVVVVGAALAFTSMSLKPLQQENAAADKMRQILMSVHIPVEPGQKPADVYNRYITDSFVVDSEGTRTEGDAFNINIKNQSKLADSERRLPVYVCTLAGGEVKYILPVYGAGLWGPIWGYVALDANGSDVYGAYFSHEGETPGLGAKIAEPAFYDQFNPAAEGSHQLTLFKDGAFYPIDVVKKGMHPLNDADYVDGVSGGTITSKGVAAMLLNCLTPYEAFLKTLNNQ